MFDDSSINSRLRGRMTHVVGDLYGDWHMFVVQTLIHLRIWLEPCFLKTGLWPWMIVMCMGLQVNPVLLGMLGFFPHLRFYLLPVWRHIFKVWVMKMGWSCSQPYWVCSMVFPPHGGFILYLLNFFLKGTFIRLIWIVKLWVNASVVKVKGGLLMIKNRASDEIWVGYSVFLNNHGVLWPG